MLTTKKRLLGGAQLLLVVSAFWLGVLLGVFYCHQFLLSRRASPSADFHEPMNHSLAALNDVPTATNVDAPTTATVEARLRALPANSTARQHFCHHRQREAVEHDTLRYQSEALEMRKRLSARWKPFSSSCTAEFSALQQSYFDVHMRNGQVPTEAPLGCQDCDTVLDLFRLLSPSPAKVFVEVGPNKGYDLIALYERWTNFTTNLVWMTTGLPPGCPWFADVDRHVFPRVIAIEPAQATFDLLTALADSLPVCNLELHRLAMSDAPGRAVFREGAKLADEASRLLIPGERPLPGASRGQYEVEVGTLDTLLHTLGDPHLDYLAIDAEGFDPLVLDGAAATLRSGRADLISFEFSAAARRPLKDQVDRLAALGYDTYYVGRRALLRLTGDGCWADAYAANVGYGNLLAVRREFELGQDLVAPFNLANGPLEPATAAALF